eukprot:scaffold21586_cov203-Isochrysis_galbana.AAC.1
MASSRPHSMVPAAAWKTRGGRQVSGRRELARHAVKRQVVVVEEGLLAAVLVHAGGGLRVADGAVGRVDQVGQVGRG